MVRGKSLDHFVLNVLAYLFVGALAVFAVLPFLVLLVSSFTPESDILRYGYTLFPRSFSLQAYEIIFRFPQQVERAYAVSVSVTLIGTAVSLLISSMSAYVMYRKDVRYRNALAFFLFFTTLFNGGLMPYYIVVTSYLHLRDTLLVLLLVPMFSVFNILILRNFMRGSIPDALMEAARIDGCGDLTMYVRIVLPLMKPALASIGLFTALGYWNDWWTPTMFVQKESLYPLQYLLYQMLSSMNVSSNAAANATIVDMPKESFKLAMTVVATGPIVLAYPFVQKYFVSGITIGAVKG